MTYMTAQISMGWRARIGVLYPEHGYTDEEFWAFAAPGVSVLMARTRVQQDDSIASIIRFAEDRDNDRTAQGFARVHVDAVAYACTAIGFLRGPDGARELNERMAAAARAPATCTITASVEAMRHLGVSRIAMATPYSDEMNASLAAFLEHHGIRVLTCRNMDLVGKIDGADLCEVPLRAVRRLAVSADTPEADAVYIPCTALRSLELIESLEQDLGKPVISANQATMWHAQRLAGVNPHIEGVGRLLRNPQPTAATRTRDAARTAQPRRLKVAARLP